MADSESVTKIGGAYFCDEDPETQPETRNGIRLVEVAKNRWRFIRVSDYTPITRSDLPTPYINSDALPRALEQVDGSFHESKSAYRRRGKELGLVEIGDAKLQPASYRPPTSAAKRRETLRNAAEAVKAGHRITRFKDGD